MPGSPGAEGAHPAEADASEAGEAWSDGQIAEALDTSIDTIARTRQRLVEGGIDTALTRQAVIGPTCCRLERRLSRNRHPPDRMTFPQFPGYRMASTS